MMKQDLNNLIYVDYKDTEMLKHFINPNARIMSKRKTSTGAKNQRKISLAIKRARFLGLLPYISR
ncbi:MAG: 30S ribosomal protein S18 [Candidatus Paceibacterota bacterium]